MRNSRLLLALFVMWASIVTVVAIGEFWDAIPTTYVTRIVTLSKIEAFLVGKLTARVIDWHRLLFVFGAPAFLALVGVWAFRWASAPDGGLSNGSSSKGVTKLITALRLTRLLTCLVAVLELGMLLPALTWIVAPQYVTGEMLAVLVLKLTLFGALALIASGLRWAILWLHKRHFGYAHPILGPRWYVL